MKYIHIYKYIHIFVCYICIYMYILSIHIYCLFVYVMFSYILYIERETNMRINTFGKNLMFLFLYF